MWSYVFEVYSESLSFIKKHRSDESAEYMVYQQIPFFACYNFFIDAIHQKDISRYIYAQETGTPAYSGDYGQQPAVWVEKYFIIKKTLNEMSRVSSKKQQQAIKKKHGIV